MLLSLRILKEQKLMKVRKKSFKKTKHQSIVKN